MTGRRGQRRSTPQARRDELIAAALELFGGRDPELVTVDEIVAHVRVSRPLFYRYFSSLRELHTAALGTVTDRLVGGLDGLAELTGATPAERVRAAVRGLIEVATEYRHGYVALLRNGSVIATSETDALVDRVRHHAVRLILDALGVPEPSPLLLLTLRCWTAVVEGALLNSLQEGSSAEGLDHWLADQLAAMLGATARHDPAAAPLPDLYG